MWQRFTERSKRIIYFAQQEARTLGLPYVATEHLLLGLVRENDSLAVRILDRLGVSRGRIRSELKQQVERGDGRQVHDMQLTLQAKRVIDLGYDEARQLNNNYFGTEHLLMGLIREDEGLAGRVLTKLGVNSEMVRREIVALQDHDSGAENHFSERTESLYRRLFKKDARVLQQKVPPELFDALKTHFESNAEASQLPSELYEALRKHILGSN